MNQVSENTKTKNKDNDPTIKRNVDEKFKFIIKNKILFNLDFDIPQKDLTEYLSKKSFNQLGSLKKFCLIYFYNKDGIFFFDAKSIQNMFNNNNIEDKYLFYLKSSYKLLKVSFIETKNQIYLTIITKEKCNNFIIYIELSNFFDKIIKQHKAIDINSIIMSDIIDYENFEKEKNITKEKFAITHLEKFSINLNNNENEEAEHLINISNVSENKKSEENESENDDFKKVDNEKNNNNVISNKFPLYLILQMKLVYSGNTYQINNKDNFLIYIDDDDFNDIFVFDLNKYLIHKKNGGIIFYDKYRVIKEYNEKIELVSINKKTSVIFLIADKNIYILSYSNSKLEAKKTIDKNNLLQNENINEIIYSDINISDNILMLCTKNNENNFIYFTEFDPNFNNFMVKFKEKTINNYNKSKIFGYYEENNSLYFLISNNDYKIFFIKKDKNEIINFTQYINIKINNSIIGLTYLKYNYINFLESSNDNNNEIISFNLDLLFIVDILGNINLLNIVDQQESDITIKEKSNIINQQKLNINTEIKKDLNNNFITISNNVSELTIDPKYLLCVKIENEHIKNKLINDEEGKNKNAYSKNNDFQLRDNSVKRILELTDKYISLIKSIEFHPKNESISKYLFNNNSYSNNLVLTNNSLYEIIKNYFIKQNEFDDFIITKINGLNTLDNEVIKLYINSLNIIDTNIKNNELKQYFITNENNMDIYRILSNKLLEQIFSDNDINFMKNIFEKFNIYEKDLDILFKELSKHKKLNNDFNNFFNQSLTNFLENIQRIENTNEFDKKITQIKENILIHFIKILDFYINQFKNLIQIKHNNSNNEYNFNSNKKNDIKEQKNFLNNRNNDNFDNLFSEAFKSINPYINPKISNYKYALDISKEFDFDDNENIYIKNIVKTGKNTDIRKQKEFDENYNKVKEYENRSNEQDLMDIKNNLLLLETNSKKDVENSEMEYKKIYEEYKNNEKIEKKDEEKKINEIKKDLNKMLLKEKEIEKCMLDIRKTNNITLNCILKMKNYFTEKNKIDEFKNNKIEINEENKKQTKIVSKIEDKSKEKNEDKKENSESKSKENAFKNENKKENDLSPAAINNDINVSPKSDNNIHDPNKFAEEIININTNNSPKIIETQSQENKEMHQIKLKDQQENNQLKRNDFPNNNNNNKNAIEILEKNPPSFIKEFNNIKNESINEIKNNNSVIKNDPDEEIKKQAEVIDSLTKVDLNERLSINKNKKKSKSRILEATVKNNNDKNITIIQRNLKDETNLTNAFRSLNFNDLSSPMNNNNINPFASNLVNNNDNEKNFFKNITKDNKNNSNVNFSEIINKTSDIFSSLNTNSNNDENNNNKVGNSIIFTSTTNNQSNQFNNNVIDNNKNSIFNNSDIAQSVIIPNNNNNNQNNPFLCSTNNIKQSINLNNNINNNLNKNNSFVSSPQNNPFLISTNNLNQNNIFSNSNINNSNIQHEDIFSKFRTNNNDIKFGTNSEFSNNNQNNIFKKQFTFGSGSNNFSSNLQNNNIESPFTAIISNNKQTPMFQSVNQNLKNNSPFTTNDTGTYF